MPPVILCEILFCRALCCHDFLNARFASIGIRCPRIIILQYIRPRCWVCRFPEGETKTHIIGSCSGMSSSVFPLRCSRRMYYRQHPRTVYLKRNYFYYVPPLNRSKKVELTCNFVFTITVSRNSVSYLSENCSNNRHYTVILKSLESLYSAYWKSF